MRISILLVVITLLSTIAWAETRIVEYPDRIVVEIIEEIKQPAESSVATTYTSGNRDQQPQLQTFVDPGSADYLRQQSSQLRDELKDLRVAQPGESAEERRQRLQRLNEKQQELQRNTRDLATIRSQAAKR